MAVDCEKFSPAAKKIFAKLKPFFPPSPWKTPHWKKEGVVIDNWTYDLRKHADRERLEKDKRNSIGYSVYMAASQYRDKNKSLNGFATGNIGGGWASMIQKNAELLLILNDLDFQIETMDLMEDL
ncbi:MAG: hypothetical protein G01um101419_78 [Parcubacteria group bacterium Gr01-1014_19]|nr:MAG: hypothetical protein G01um101419_78 [Parcubacteria group bacterium Gr01-1014_19]